MTTKLISAQRHFAQHLKSKSDQNILREIPYSKAEAISRLNIYRNNVYGGFESVLLSAFSVTIKILGEKKFSKIFTKYCEKFPSKSGDLNDFNQNFPQFLAEFEPLYLQDLAQLELLHHQAYFAAKSSKDFDIKNFQKLPPEKFSNVVFTLDKSCSLFTSQFAIFTIWQEASTIKNYQKQQYVLIKSDDILPLTKEEFLFLQLIQKKKKLLSIYNQLCKELQAQVDIGALIQKFISNRTIIDYA